MSKWFAFFQKDNIAELNNDKAKLLEKKQAIEDEIKAIDERIEQLESENKGNN
jgi:predicted  nucleic acid-binding Zn-ribbon protein